MLSLISLNGHYRLPNDVLMIELFYCGIAIDIKVFSKLFSPVPQPSNNLIKSKRQRKLIKKEQEACLVPRFFFKWRHRLQCQSPFWHLCVSWLTLHRIQNSVERRNRRGTFLNHSKLGVSSARKKANICLHDYRQGIKPIIILCNSMWINIHTTFVGTKLLRVQEASGQCSWPNDIVL